MITSTKITSVANDLMLAINNEISDIRIQIEALQLKLDTLEQSKIDIKRVIDFEPEPDKKIKLKTSRKTARKQKSSKISKPVKKKSSKAGTVTAQASMTRDQYKEWISSQKKGSKIDYKVDMKEKLGGDYWCKNFIYSQARKGALKNLGSGVFEVIDASIIQ